MKRVFAISVLFGIVALLTPPVAADIVVLNNGQVLTGKVSTAASGRLKVTLDFGDQFFARNQVAGFYLTPEGMEAEGYYQAGLLVLSKGQRETAAQLFTKCVQYDPSYRAKCTAALKGGPSAVAPTAHPAGTPAPATPSPALPTPRTQVVRIQCSQCGGTGVIMSSTSLREGGAERPRPCPVCGGRGYKDLRIPPGYEICSDCGGFGATMGGGRSDSSSFILKKDMCPRCAGRGVVKAPWKPADPNAPDSTGPTMMVSSPSPSPGTPPSRPTTALEHAKAVTSGSPQGQPPSRPVGPSSIRPVSPTVLVTTPPAEPSTGSGGDETTASEEEEVIKEDEGTSSDTASDEGTEELESEKGSRSRSDYVQPGIGGWVGRHKWYIILGGVALLVFAIVFNKMSAKK